MKSWLAVILALLACLPAMSQSLDDWVEASSYPEELSAWLDDLREHPLDLNVAPSSRIALLPYFDSRSAEEIVSARRIRSFSSMEEVVRLGGLNDAQRYSLLQFATVEPADVRSQGARVQLAGGERAPDARTVSSEAMWSKTRAEFRQASGVRGYAWGRHLTGEQETFSDVAAGLELRPSDSYRFLIGDFQHEAGTGLVFGAAYGMSNWLSSASVSQPSQSRGLALRPSSDRRSLLRGVGIGGRWGALDATVIGSWSQLDAAVGANGVESLTEGESSSSQSLAEARADQVEERLLGFSATASASHWQVGAAGYRARYLPAFAPRRSDEKTLRVTGDGLSVGSLFARANLGRADVVTEFAESRPGGAANQTAVSVSTPGAAFAIYHTYAAADFFSPRAKAWTGFSGEAGNVNTTGMRIRTTWPSHSMTIHAATGRTPFRTVSSPLTKNSSQLELRWSTTVIPMVTTEILAGRSWNEATSETSPSVNTRLDRGRLEFQFRSPAEYRMRLEIRSAQREGSAGHDLGTLVFVQGKSQWHAFNVYGRITLFNFESDAVAVQPYENVPVGSYPLVSLSGTGSRAAVMLSREWQAISASAKAALTRKTFHERDRTDVDLSIGLGIRG